MRVLTVFFLIVLLFCDAPSGAQSADYGGESRTYVFMRETADGKKLAPLYEYLSLDWGAGDGGTGSVSLHMAGWGRLDAGEKRDGDSTDGDLQYGYLSLRKEGIASADLGRTYVSGASGLELIDGASVGVHGPLGLGLSAYGGLPVLTGVPEGDALYGGRLSQGMRGMYEVGLSYMKETDEGSDLREEESVDVLIQRLPKLDVSGRSSYNSLTDGWMEHSYTASVGPFAGFRLAPVVSWISYGDFFQAATSSAFRPPGISDPDETALAAGGYLTYEPGWNIILSADYKNYSYDIAGGADYSGGTVSYGGGTAWGGVSYHRMDGSADELKYGEIRVYGKKKLWSADVSADYTGVSYDEEINGVKNSHAASLAAGYDFGGSARAAADVRYSEDPFFDSDVRGSVKFIYRFGLMARQYGEATE